MQKYNIKPKGILHLGASYGQEYDEYMKNNITRQFWIEAIPDVYKKLKENIFSNSEAIAINACISDSDEKEVEFKYTAINQGESSSFLEMGTHKYIHPEVLITEIIKMKTITVDTIFNLNKLITEPSQYDFLNMDLQGCEGHALRGMGKTLPFINNIYTEVNAQEVYNGCMLLPDFDNYLSDCGFERKELKWGVENHWGDAFYMRK